MYLLYIRPNSTFVYYTSFTLSLLKDTIVGFSERFKDLHSNGYNFKSLQFTVITNRPISDNFKDNIAKLSKGKKGSLSFNNTIKKYTKLSDAELKSFCALLRLCDGEGNYDAQKHGIHKELVKLTCSYTDNDIISLLVAKISEKVEPGNNNQVQLNDVLQVFGVKDKNEFFPAPPLFEPIDNYIPRVQHHELIKTIRSATSHTVLTANGGVGKSIICNQLAKEFKNGSFAVAYDCYGNGGYLRTSQKRHRPIDAFVQISNQLAKEGLCDPLVPTRNEPDDCWMRAFLLRLSEASSRLKRDNDEALLLIFIDAADNAGMAASDFNESCFATQLIRECVPENCRIIFSSRPEPERIKLFDPPSSSIRISLESFTNDETLKYIQTQYRKATLNDAIEFRRLTSGNPRVQANALSLGEMSISNLLSSLGTSVVTVNDLISKQLEAAISKLTDAQPKGFRYQIETICMGLATLPPYVPLKVLAEIANVSVDTVKSFIADLGRPLWMTDNAVQFRDEPTEKWFKDTFIASKDNVINYIDKLKPIANQFSYIAETLPLLMHKAELFDELVELALSDEMLPEDNPIDARKVRIFRLQFAFKAALKKKRYFEAGKLALRAGEEVAGDQRQLDIFSKNIDLITTFLSPERIQELAYRKAIRGAWDGSETIYSASLLSSIDECKGEAISYLRSGNYWLQSYFEQQKEKRKNKSDSHHVIDKIDKLDILEMLSSNYKLFGEEQAVKFICSRKSMARAYQITKLFISRLVDKGYFDSIKIDDC